MKIYKTIAIRIFVCSVFICLLHTSSSKAQSHLANNNTRYRYLTDTTSDFNGLINQFKGRIIYVDIWATWCSPCRNELRMKKNIHDFKQFADKNNIILLYICCDKNGDNWKQFIAANQLSGYHILVNSHIDSDFHTTFSSVQTRNGKPKRSFFIPRHMIIDTAGRVADSTADSQGAAAVYAALNKLLGRSTK
ncbi:thioredoxin-like domain-containing protein [Mucilaginibacter sp. BT774]|uniref:TlpA family protein disulfide reductase n=1 Tax=Mucilaginibacter sp. BT774 TaxID=3062276 RepID=UPI0026758954|nr:thioredoxin-like domain-containing protein [Mucilaginibacter sp. BT774]MDO3624666.1 thioredoxin-like domain-containing protein [Mucilaginibacter sp. BT774]